MARAKPVHRRPKRRLKPRFGLPSLDTAIKYGAMLLGLAFGYGRLQTKVDVTAEKVDLLYQRALLIERGAAGPYLPLKEE